MCDMMSGNRLVPSNNRIRSRNDTCTSKRETLPWEVHVGLLMYPFPESEPQLGVKKGGGCVMQQELERFRLLQR